MRRWKPLLVSCFVALLAHAAAAVGPGFSMDLGALAVPEPSTLLLVSFELAGLAVRRRPPDDRGTR